MVPAQPRFSNKPIGRAIARCHPVVYPVAESPVII